MNEGYRDMTKELSEHDHGTIEHKETVDDDSFLSNFVNSMERLPPEFEKVLHDNFWELV